MKMPFESGEGPYGMVLCPSRELARQTYEVMQRYTHALERHARIRVLLCTGGIDMREQVE